MLQSCTLFALCVCLFARVSSVYHPSLGASMPLPTRFEPRCPSIVLLLFYCTHLSHSRPPHQSAAATTSTAVRATERAVRPTAARYTHGAASIVRNEQTKSPLPTLSRHLSVAVNSSNHPEQISRQATCTSNELFVSRTLPCLNSFFSLFYFLCR
jgi:hypothetical protein